MTLAFTPEQEAARERLAVAGEELRGQLGRRKLTPEEKAELLARLRARAEARDEEERHWHALGLEVAEEPEEPLTYDERSMVTLSRLFVLLEQHRPAWQRDALCQEYPDLPWFPERGDSTVECKAVCDRCAVATECRAFAVENAIEAGCWGGVTGRSLRRLRAA